MREIAISWGGHPTRMREICTREIAISWGGTLQSGRIIMSESYIPAMLDACTQTPYPGSELLDPNPFVKTPTKSKAKSARETFGPSRYYVEDQVCM